MAVTVRVEPIRKDIEVIVRDTREKDGAQAFAEFAREEIADAADTNASILGVVPRYTIAVDGRRVISLESVRANSSIFVEFELTSDVLVFIHQQLVEHSPVKGGRYRASHILFADGAQIEPTIGVPHADEYVFVNSAPYARKIERGASSQAPHGVYQAVAAIARQRFGNIAKISFAYKSLSFSATGSGRRDSRNPAIMVRPNR